MLWPYFFFSIAEMVYSIGLTAEFKGKKNTAIQADTWGGMVTPPTAEKLTRMIGTC